MKNVKLMLLAVIAMLFLGMNNVSAQEKSTVMISGYTYGVKYRIEIIKPDYGIEQKEHAKDDNILVSIKKEIDYWLNQDYKLVEATSNSLSSTGERLLFVLIKE